MQGLSPPTGLQWRHVEQMNQMVHAMEVLQVQLLFQALSRVQHPPQQAVEKPTSELF